MDKETIIKKIQALLHDPPEKALILGKVGHEERAVTLMKKIEGSTTITAETKDADHIASASDRINFPKDIEGAVDFSKEPVVIHPLSGKEFEIPTSALSAVSGIDYKEVSKNVDEAINELTSKYSDLELRYFSLWGELQEIIRSKEDGGSALGQLWELLPADTRIPDHSIWEHRRVTSAIAGALPEPSLLLFSIGPVQDFIATARKTQDLWSGSYMLSYIAWTVMQLISEEMGPDSVIFPDLIGQPFCNHWLAETKELSFVKRPGGEELSSPTLPNRLLAILPKDKVEVIANDAECKVKAVFKEICFSVKEKIENVVGELKGDAIWDRIWERQTRDFIEVYWAILPMGRKGDYINFIELYKALLGNELLKDFEKLLKEYETKGFSPNIGTMYGSLYRFLEKGLGSRKVTRDFSQHSEPHYKCTVCGVREPVHPEKHNNQSCEDYGALAGFWKEKIRPKFPDTKATERLCAVCATKRFSVRFYFKDKMHFDIRSLFPSTSTMATAAFKLRLIENADNGLLVKAHDYANKIHALVGETAMGEASPMIFRACKGNKLLKDFSELEGDWLYKESLDKETLRREYGQNNDAFEQLFIAAKDAFDNFQKALEEFQKKNKIDLGTPSKYYAIIQMDGDNMGKWVAGENAPKIKSILHPALRKHLEQNESWKSMLEYKRPLNPSLHIATSRALKDFSLKVVREIVERDYLGKLIYSGGDDVLAFVSLRDLPGIMRCLRAYFSGSLVCNEEEGVKVDFENGSGFVPVDGEGYPLSLKMSKKPKGFLYAMGTTATVSMGVAIVHHSYDLSKALQEARDAEKKAKNEIKKNAFYISLNKRSGGTEDFGAKWYYENDEYFEVIPVLEDLIKAFSDEKGISPKFAYDFRAELMGLNQTTLPDQAIKVEMARVAKRHKHKEFPKEKAEGIAADFLRLKKNGVSLEEISKLLIIATFLARRENQ